ncbi:MAG TPA: hypothetical protein VMQ17_00210 [Candidatus Sulfotelmatobacter sp.]|nr:hypothetical protein [Candidatus Sulfotelmatobacter sp.]
MPTYLFRLSCRSRRLLLALLLAFSGSLFAQGLSVAPLPQPSSLEPEQTAVNVASIEPLPRAPGNATTFASGLALSASPGSMAVVASAPVVARPKEFALHPSGTARIVPSLRLWARWQQRTFARPARI